MRKLMIALAAMATLAPVTTVVAQPGDREYRREVRDARQDYRRDVRDARRDARQRDAWRNYNRYDWNRGDPRFGNRYDASRYYRDGRYYQERRLSRNDRIYRGSNGRYYCRRDDGTTGLLIGGVAGGLLGNTVASGGSELLGTLIGAGAGALLGRQIDRGDVRCR